jgi:hypothetical protein
VKVLGVFLPALMGVGILVSGLVLIMEWARRLVPNAGVRRRIRVVRATHRVTAGIAETIGVNVGEVRFLHRVARSRWTYLAWGSVTAAVALFLVFLAMDTYDDAASLLYENPWMPGLAVVVGIVLGPLALLMLAPGLLYQKRPRTVEWIVRSTWLGRAEVPEDDPGKSPPVPAGPGESGNP